MYKLTREDHLYRDYLRRVHDDYAREYGEAIPKVEKLKQVLNEMMATLD